MKKTSTKNQYLATIIVNLTTLSVGFLIGWLSPSLPVLQSETDAPLSQPLNEDHVSWVGSLMNLGSLIGTILYAYLADVLGRKATSCLIMVPLLMSWLCVLIAVDVHHIYISRILAGVGGGGIMGVVPIFVAEIADDNVRGTLASLLVVSINLGILLAFMVGAVVSYSTMSYLFTGVTVISLILCVLYLPETPLYLRKIGKIKEANKAARWLQGLPTKLEDILEEAPETQKLDESKVENIISEEKEDLNRITLKDLCSTVPLKGLGMGIMLLGIQQASGVFAVISYAGNIFRDAGSTLDANICAIMVGSLQLIGSYVAASFVEKAGRKVLMILSCIGTSVCLFTLGTFTYLKHAEYDVNAFGWIPVVALSGTVFCCSCGIGPLPFVILSEILSEKVRGTIFSICICCYWVMAFLVCRYFNDVALLLGMYGCFWLFGASLIVGAIWTWIFVPETKGRPLSSILEELAGAK